MVGILIRIKRDIQIYKLIYHLVVIKKEHIEIINVLFNILLAHKRYAVTKPCYLCPSAVIFITSTTTLLAAFNEFTGKYS